ncbi:ADP-ribosylglycohydrolase family protein [Microbacterium sp. LRZ72]|nr:ADP-ribosylglycohydrolase family protein [Microbacterium sp. LRZ72]MDX2375198.1 ADP-ribosylglycohydrolase family protein [Microbacterium sp. LRZ72]
MTRLDALQLDRAVGAVLASAAGDALGSQYELGPSLPDGTPVEFGRGCFGHALGEWTDDTSMAMPILQALSAGESLDDPGTLDRITGRWIGWSRTARDVGAHPQRARPPVGRPERARGIPHRPRRARAVGTQRGQRLPHAHGARRPRVPGSGCRRPRRGRDRRRPTHALGG